MFLWAKNVVVFKKQHCSVPTKKLHNISFTGKSLSEGLILVSTNPQYDKNLFIDLPIQYMKITNSEHGENVLCA